MNRKQNETPCYRCRTVGPCQCPPKTLWFTDNGAVYCIDHLGMTARYSGRDISGQPIERITDDDVRLHPELKCETGKP